MNPITRTTTLVKARKSDIATSHNSRVRSGVLRLNQVTTTHIQLGRTNIGQFTYHSQTNPPFGKIRQNKLYADMSIARLIAASTVGNCCMVDSAELTESAAPSPTPL